MEVIKSRFNSFGPPFFENLYVGNDVDEVAINTAFTSKTVGNYGGR